MLGPEANERRWNHNVTHWKPKWTRFKHQSTAPTEIRTPRTLTYCRSSRWPHLLVCCFFFFFKKWLMQRLKCFSTGISYHRYCLKKSRFRNRIGLRVLRETHRKAKFECYPHDQMNTIYSCMFQPEFSNGLNGQNLEPRWMTQEVFQKLSNLKGAGWRWVNGIWNWFENVRLFQPWKVEASRNGRWLSYVVSSGTFFEGFFL